MADTVFVIAQFYRSVTYLPSDCCTIAVLSFYRQCLDMRLVHAVDVLSGFVTELAFQGMCFQDSYLRSVSVRRFSHDDCFTWSHHLPTVCWVDSRCHKASCRLFRWSCRCISDEYRRSYSVMGHVCILQNSKDTFGVDMAICAHERSGTLLLRVVRTVQPTFTALNEAKRLSAKMV